MKPAIVIVAACILCCAGAQAQQSPAEARLRDQLRQTTLDLRQAQDENSALKLKLEQATPAVPAAQPAAAAADQAKLRGLAVQVQAGNARATALQRQLDEAQKSLEQWKQAYDQVVALAKARDAEAKKYQGLYGEADTRGKSCEADNVKLVQIGDELLERYKHKGVWSAMGDAEPLTGLHRVDMEKLAQDYHARIVDATVKPAPAP